jgi:nitrogen regulatory protein PII
MKPVKRIEIVADAVFTEDLLAALRAAGAPGYTVMRNVAGFGERGERGADQPTDVLGNVLVLIAAEPELVPKLVDAVRPILTRFGGMCLVSDALWTLH